LYPLFRDIYTCGILLKAVVELHISDRPILIKLFLTVWFWLNNYRCPECLHMWLLWIMICASITFEFNLKHTQFHICSLSLIPCIEDIPKITLNLIRNSMVVPTKKHSYTSSKDMDTCLVLFSHRKTTFCEAYFPPRLRFWRSGKRERHDEFRRTKNETSN
jgi:hypothetical protein